jgi:predicted ribosomally synthesized peptide with SipW-like signal peptide
MTKTKSTKRALLMSGLVLLMCVSMLISSTYAWFTDSVTSAGNIIKSGTLDVDLVDADDNSMEGKVIEFKTADNRAQDQILWEPGCTYETKPVYVVNKGNLALKYEIVINGINGNAKLLEAIEWTVTVGTTTTALADLKGELVAGAKSEAIVLSGHMKEEAGNEYQGLTAEGISILVYATQLTSESDSFNNQYDKDAEYAANTMLKNVAAVAAGETATVKLESDGYVVINETNAIGAKVAGNVTLDLNGKTLFVKVEDGDAHMSLFNIVRGGKLTVTGNGTIEMLSGKNENKVTAIFNNTSGELVVENGTYKMDVKTYAQGSLIPAIIDNNGNAAGATTTINGGNFYHTRNMFRNFPSNNGITKLTINGGTFNGKADDWAAIWNQKAIATTNEGQSLIEINGGTFNYVEIDNEFNTGVTVAPGVAMPTPVSSDAELTDAIASGEKNIVLAADTKVTIPSGAATSKDVTISGDKSSTVVLVNTNPGYEGKLSYQDNANLTFKGITFDANQITGICARGGDVVFEDCFITGELEQTIGDSFKFIGCTFDVGVTQVGYGCSDVVFEKCTFETDGYGIKIYIDNNTASLNLTVKECSFKNTGSTARSAILIDHIIDGISYDITIDGCTFEGYSAVPTPTYNIWAERMIVTDSFIKTTDGQYIFSYQTGAVGGAYHKLLTSDKLTVTVK